MTWVPFHNFLLRQWNGNAISLVSGGVKVMITTSAYTPNQAAHDFKDDVTNEVLGTGYSAGGFALVNPTVALSSGIVTFDADDLTVSGNAAGFSNGRNMVAYWNSGSASTSPLIAYHTEGSDFGNVLGDLPIQFATAGIIRTTPA